MSDIECFLITLNLDKMQSKLIRLLNESTIVKEAKKEANKSFNGVYQRQNGKQLYNAINKFNPTSLKILIG